MSDKLNKENHIKKSTDQEQKTVLEVAKQILIKYEKAFKELAK